METKLEWSKRLTADVIVLVDWFGERLPGTAAFSLQEIFLKVFGFLKISFHVTQHRNNFISFFMQWDPSNKYKGTIKLLSGGFDDWLARFPLQTTNPHATAAIKPIASTLPSESSMQFKITPSRNIF